MNRIFTLLLLLFISGSASAQLGYKGRRHIIGISALCNVPVLSGSIGQDHYYSKKDVMTARKDLFDYGLSLEYDIVLGKRLSLGLELTGRRFEVFGDRRYSNSFLNGLIGKYVRTTEIRLEPVGMNSLVIMPRINISSKNDFAGAGISHKIGFGYRLTKIRNHSYNYAINEFYSEDSTSTAWTPTDNYILDVDWKAYRAISISYGIKLAVPITDAIHFVAGCDYYINLYVKPSQEEFIANKQDVYNYEDLYYNVQRENLFTWNLRTGINIVL